MTNRRKGWHNPKKDLEGTTSGKCPYCNKHVESLEHHIHDKHKGEKGSKESLWSLMLKRIRPKKEV